MDLALGLIRLHLFENAGGVNNYLTIQPITDLKGGTSNQKRAAIGAIVLVDLNGGDSVFNKDNALIRTIVAGQQTHLGAHFGLVDHTVVDIRVYFPDGGMKELLNVNVLNYKDQPLTVIQTP